MALSAFILGRPRYAANTPWRAGWAIAAVVLIFLAAQFVTSAVFPWIEDVPPGPLPGVPAGSADVEPEAIRALMTWLLLTQATATAFVLAAASLFGGSVRSVLKLGPLDEGGRTIGYAIVVMAALLGTFNLIVYWLRQSDMLEDMQLYMAFIRSDSWLVALTAIGVGAPLMEELLFRGFLLSALGKTSLGFWPAAVITTVAWVALHWGYSFVGLLEVFVIGIYFSWLLWRTGSLWPALICHALYNSLLVIVLRFADVGT